MKGYLDKYGSNLTRLTGTILLTDAFSPLASEGAAYTGFTRT